MRRISTAVAGLLAASPAFSEVVGELEATAVAPKGYTRPTTSALQGIQERQGMPEVPGSDKVLISERRFSEPHIALAKQLHHPLARLAHHAQPDLVAAVEWVAARGEDAQAIAEDRRQVRLKMEGMRSRLSKLDASLRALQTPGAARVQQQGCSMALIAAMIKAAGLPDTESLRRSRHSGAAATQAQPPLRRSRHSGAAATQAQPPLRRSRH
jgi:hypothetical protein